LKESGVLVLFRSQKAFDLQECARSM